MLRISKLADYGTVVMVYLAKYPDSLCNARDIAEHTHLAIPTVSKLLKRLTTAGLLVSVRGVSGGYRLKKPAAAISVAEIIFAFEESRGLVECFSSDACFLQQDCRIQGNWRLISKAIDLALESVSLEGLAKPKMAVTELERIKQLAIGVSGG